MNCRIRVVQIGSILLSLRVSITVDLQLFRNYYVVNGRGLINNKVSFWPLNQKMLCTSKVIPATKYIDCKFLLELEL